MIEEFSFLKEQVRVICFQEIKKLLCGFRRCLKRSLKNTALQLLAAMKTKKYILSALVAAALCLCGCSIQTVDQLYCLPKRSEDYIDLQSAIDKAMTGLEYCAPLAGENRQTVQMTDLNGDGAQEYLLFAKGGTERPLRILVFEQLNDTYHHTDTIESNGTAFDQVEYVQMDGEKGVEIVVGCQISDQPLRSVSIYQYSKMEALRLHQAIWTTGIRAALENGGVVNDHHGVGIKLGRLMKEQYGPAMQVFEGIKKQLDPNGIMNPFKLGL